MQPSTQDTDNPRGPRSKTSYLKGRNFGHGGYYGDVDGGTSSDDSFVLTKTDRKGDGNRAPSSRRNRGIDDSTSRGDGRTYRCAEEDNDESDTFTQFAKTMGDNLIALRKIHEKPPRWNGPRIKVYSGKARENLDDFEDGIRSSCDSLGIGSNRERVRYMEGFLDGDAAEFVSTLSTSGRYNLDEVFQKMQDSRFRDNRSQTDFLYMLTLRRQDPKIQTIR